MHASCLSDPKHSRNSLQLERKQSREPRQYSSVLELGPEVLLQGDLRDSLLSQNGAPQLSPRKLQEAQSGPHDVVVEPDGALLGADRVVVAHDPVSEAQPVGFQQGEEPAQDQERTDLDVAVVIGRDRIGEARYRVDLQLGTQGSEGFDDALEEVGQETFAFYSHGGHVGGCDLRLEPAVVPDQVQHPVEGVVDEHVRAQFQGGGG